MILSEILNEIEQLAPASLQESYDNAGLLTGNRSMKITGALICLDSIEAVIDEAIENKFNLVIAHHPIIFSGLKKINGNNYVERVIIKAIKNDIAIYAAHTNLDNVINGVNAKISEKIGLKNLQILSPKDGLLKKLVTFCPNEQAAKVREALGRAGAGSIGNYDNCSFNLEGTGTFRANESAEPFVGNKGEIHFEKETRIEVIFENFKEKAVLRALFENHPYEEVAYDVYSLANSLKTVGSGMIGEFETEMEEKDFLNLLKTNFKANGIRHTALLGKKIKTVALCGGAGSFLLKAAMARGAGAFVSGDFKYHEFFDADGKIVVTDIGHFESEQFTGEIFYDLIKKKFPTFAVRFSKIHTNPVNYF
ncbi:MAG: Nif3-like dinuclear metal center hexameric protein [Bacteroidia bacterium]|nr:Nif3-like dinuclear metal center hexameric protein [Bacteroidia bacterium]